MICFSGLTLTRSETELSQKALVAEKGNRGAVIFPTDAGAFTGNCTLSAFLGLCSLLHLVDLPECKSPDLPWLFRYIGLKCALAGEYFFDKTVDR